MRTPNWLIPAAVLLLGGFHLLTLRAGHEWGDDFSLYVAHAKNLAEGRNYADTGYLYNPHFPSLSPRTYPPVFPLILVPVYWMFGLNLMAMKAYVVLLFTAFLGVLAVVLGRRLPRPYVLMCLCLVALNPLVWSHKDRLLSEAPFMLLTYLALLLADKAVAADPRSRTAWGLGMLAGLAAFLAFGVRSMGVVLLPTMLAALWLKQRRLGGVALAMTVPFVLGLVLQKLLLTLDGSYLDQLVFDPLLPVRVVVSLGEALGAFVDNGYLPIASKGLYLCLLLLAAAGYVRRLRVEVGVLELYLPATGLLLASFPYAEGNGRYLLPLLPLFFLYACEGLIWLVTTFSWVRLEAPLAGVLAVAVFLTYAARFTRLEWGPVREGVTSPEAVALFDFVRTQTQPRDVFLFQKPRALALFTGRQASALHVPSGDDDLWKYLRRIEADYVIVCQQFTNNRDILEPFVERHRPWFEPVYQDRVFNVYRIRENPRADRDRGPGGFGSAAYSRQ
jgi:4-amino-4-deoxy-L-arabinose transferase-like glycosyltransferase